MTQYIFTAADMNFIPAGTRAPEYRYLPGATEAARNHELEARSVRIFSGRIDEDAYRLDRHGFQYVREPSVLGWRGDLDDAEVRRDYYPEVADILRGATGARDVLIFDHTVRRAGADGARQPALHVHNDYTDTSAPKRVAQLLGEAEARRRFSSGRVSQVNLWRPLRATVQALPLGFVDASTVRPTDLRKLALIYPDRVGEIYGLSHGRGQRWTYFPEMTPDEAVLIKGYDSALDGRARFTPHSGFVDPNTPADAPPRESIEVRAFLFH
jgi:hypothetical protein